MQHSSDCCKLDFPSSTQKRESCLLNSSSNVRVTLSVHLRPGTARLVHALLTAAYRSCCGQLASHSSVAAWLQFCAQYSEQKLSRVIVGMISQVRQRKRERWDGCRGFTIWITSMYCVTMM